MGAEHPLHDDFEFDGWIARPRRLILERDGEIVHVKPKTMEVLVALAECEGAVLGRDQLLEKVWQNKYVSDDVITQAIAELRRALRDDFRNPLFVETVPRRGYRLIPAVRHLSPGGLSESTSGGPEQTVSQDHPGFLPVRRTAVAAALAVALVSIAWAAIRTQPDIAGEMAAEPPLISDSRPRPGDSRPTSDTEAYELYLKARQKFRPHRAAGEQMDEALSLARRAVERDQGFALAFALIAEIQTFRGFWNHGPREEILADARQAASAALEIEPELSYPHAVRGLALAVLDWKWEEGYRQAARATELDPDDPRSLSLRAMLSLTRGKSAEAVQLAHRAYELDPISPHALGILSWVLYQARQYDQAAEFMTKTLEADPDAAFARNFRPAALAYAGRHTEALAAELSRSMEGSESGRGERLALIDVLAGRREEARQRLMRLPLEGPVRAAGYLGDKEILFERLDRLVEKRMTNYLMWLRTDPAWDPVRGDTRFTKVLERIGLAG